MMGADLKKGTPSMQWILIPLPMNGWLARLIDSRLEYETALMAVLRDDGVMDKPPLKTQCGCAAAGYQCLTSAGADDQFVIESRRRIGG